jgi:hypothetical protein
LILLHGSGFDLHRFDPHQMATSDKTDQRHSEAIRITASCVADASDSVAFCIFTPRLP